MNRAIKVVLAVGLPAAILAVGQAASASAPPTEPPGADAGVPVPADFVSVTDDTGTITMMVPGSWTDVNGAPSGERPSLWAAPDLLALFTSVEVPGVMYDAEPFSADTATLASDHSYADQCASQTTEQYDDGLFVGTYLIETGCGTQGTAEHHVVVANPPDQSFTAVVDIQIASPDQSGIVDGILATFTTTGGAPSSTNVPSTGSSTSIPASPTTGAATGAFPPPTGEIPADWTHLVDDTQTIAISVPSAWTVTDLVPAQNEDGSPQPWISATTDQDLFFPPAGEEDTFSVPGVIFRAYPFNPDTTQRLATSSMHDVCTAGPLETYDDGVFVGHIQTFTACNGTASSIVRVSANPADQAFTADLLIQLTGQADDAATLNGLLLSFNQVNPGAGPATTVAGAPSTTAAAAPTTTAAAVTSTTAAGSSPFVELLQQQLRDQLGLEITPEQGQCLLDNSSDLDPEDLPAVMAVLTTCGVDVFDLPSG
jgi:hypothetical protein